MRCELLKNGARGADARSQPAFASCVEKFTPLPSGCVCPHRCGHPQDGRAGWLSARPMPPLNWARCGACGAALTLAGCCAPRRRGPTAGGWQWPLRPPPAVVRAFDAPSPNWQRRAPRRGPGRRAGPAGLRRRRRDGGIRRAAGRTAGGVAGPPRRPAHQLRAGRAAVRAGQRVVAGDVDRRADCRALRLPGAGVPALGRDVGPGVARRLRRPAGLLASTPVRLSRWQAENLLREQLSVGLRPVVGDENWAVVFGLVRWLRRGSGRSTLKGCFG